MSDTLRCRRRLFENSIETALIAASIPPMPSPVTMRHVDRPASPLAVVAITMPVAMTARHPRIAGRRPIRSATPPSTAEPTAMPMSSIDSTMPSAPRSMPHSVAMPGEAKLMESTSNPSRAFRATVIATTSTCCAVIGERASVSRGSAFMVGVTLRQSGVCCQLLQERIGWPGDSGGNQGSCLHHGVFEPEHHLVRIFPEGDEYRKQGGLVERDEEREVVEDGALHRTATRVAQDG